MLCIAYTNVLCIAYANVLCIAYANVLCIAYANVLCIAYANERVTASYINTVLDDDEALFSPLLLNQTYNALPQSCMHGMGTSNIE